MTAAAPTTSMASAATPRTSAACWASCCASTRAAPAGAPTACRRAIPSSAARARAARSTPTGCATRGASRSTAATGDLTIGDVGQNAVEEIDFAREGAAARGANYGWRPFEGSRRNFQEPAPDAVAPVIEHATSAGNCSITGGDVVRDAGVPALLGRYVYGDFCEGRLRSARLSAGSAQGDAAIPGLAKVGSLSSFGEDARGRVYVVSLSGPVYRLVAG